MRTGVITPLIHDDPIWIAELNGLTRCQVIHRKCLLGKFLTVEL